MTRLAHIILLAVLTGLGMAAQWAAEVAYDSSGPVAFLLVAATGLAGTALIYGPGLVLARALSPQADGMVGVILRGTVLTLLGLPPILWALGLVLPAPLTGPGFALFLGLATVPGLLLLWRRGHPPLSGWRMDLTAMVLVPLGLLALLFPKFLWESLNGDGAHVFETMRYMIIHGVPFWSEEVSAFATYPTTIWMEVIAGAPFVRLFGEVPLAARLPVLAGMALLTGVVLALIRRDRQASVTPIQVATLGAALILYAASLGWQASYNPYFADIALPLAREPMVMVIFLGFIWSFLETRRTGMFIFAALGYFTLPSIPVLIGFWLGAVFVIWRPIPWRRLIEAGLLSGLAFATGMALVLGLVFADLMAPSGEFGLKSLLTRLRFVSVFEIERLAYLAVPCGLIPAAGLLALGWQDRETRAMALMALGYGTFFYVQAYRVLPHHFAPIPVLALIVFWRLRPVIRWPVAATGLALTGVIAGGFLARPADWHPHTGTGDFASRISFEQNAYRDADPDDLLVAHALLGAAFPMDYSENASDRIFIGSPLSWYSHAMGAKPADTPVDYTIRAGIAGPGEHVLASAGNHVLVTHDWEIHKADQSRTDLIRSINPLFYVPRRIVFGAGPRDGPRPVWVMAAVLGFYKP